MGLFCELESVHGLDTFLTIFRFETVDAAQRCIESLRKYRNLHPSFSKVRAFRLYIFLVLNPIIAGTQNSWNSLLVKFAHTIHIRINTQLFAFVANLPGGSERERHSI